MEELYENLKVYFESKAIPFTQEDLDDLLEFMDERGYKIVDMHNKKTF